MPITANPPRQAASILLLRDSAIDQLEVLLQRRHLTMPFAPGENAFPGGGAEPCDQGDLARTATRELFEEEHISVRPDALVPLHEWVTPAALQSRRRYTVQYFAALSPANAPEPSAAESAESLWVEPPTALREFKARRMPMVAPTWWHLALLADHNNTLTVLQVLEHLVPQPPITDRLRFQSEAATYYSIARLDGSYIASS